MSLRPFSPILALLVTLAAACRSTADTPREVYEAVLTDLGDQGAGGFDSAVLARQDKRFLLVESWVEENKLKSAEDHLWSAGALVESDEERQLELAHALALRAAELGDARGFTFGAYAEDKLLVDRTALYQRYGTVIVYQPVFERYELYPVDPLTTDAVRQAMGVPPLAELEAQVAELNERPITARLRGEIVRELDDAEHPLPVEQPAR